MIHKKVKTKKKKKAKKKVSTPKPQSLQVIESLKVIDIKNQGALGVVSEGIANKQAVVRKKKTRK